MFLPVYSLAQKREYSGPVMSKNKINIMSRNETKRNIAYADDLVINYIYIYIYNVPRKHQSQRGLIPNFCVNTFEVLPLCYLC